MAFVWSALERAYTFVNYDMTDPRTMHVPVIMRPFTMLALMGIYTLFVTRIGPYLMRDRQPFELRRTLIIYNIFQILYNSYLFYGFGTLWFGVYNWRCEQVDRSNSPNALLVINLCIMYYFLKYIDWLDTVFFVLRKKSNQITFLHIYHHSMMILLAWQGLKYFPGGHVTFLCLANTFVHAVMYAYYLASAINPKMVWWKKYVTQLQLVQHVGVGVHLAQLFVHNPCGFSLYPPLMLTPQASLLVVLFMRFYFRAYGSSKEASRKGATTANRTADQIKAD